MGWPAACWSNILTPESREIEAIYEGGVFKPVVPVELPEYQRVTVLVSADPPSAHARTFDEAPTLDELAREQGVQPITDPLSIGGDFWPEDEDLDEFIATIRKWRQEGTN
jgi:predicted DNA-binding antitoxin AbrB/MazE fold protein